MVVLTFDRGTLLLRGGRPDGPTGEDGGEPLLDLPDARLDRRVEAVRVPAHRYHAAVLALRARGLGYEDRARAYTVLEDLGRDPPPPRPYQEEAVTAWRAAGRRGVVVLPTGAGKTLVALLAIRDARRSALVVVPTLDLLHQWFDLLAAHFGPERVGAIGGGEHRPAELTVTTYDSAYLHLERLGDRFGLLICDEAHHLAGPSYLQGVRMALAPFRLGLTATPLEDERAHAVAEALGPVVFARGIRDLAGDYLSTYETVRLQVQLSEAERAQYEAARARFRGFVQAHGIRLGGPGGWVRFLEASSQSREGRAALAAWREQRRIALATPGKLEHLDAVLRRHPGERTLVFTSQNDDAYAVSRRFLVPAITHQTRPRERRGILDGLDRGTTPVVVTSRVLNEGVDVPRVSVGVVLSGTATVREHVQRLGRLLRKVEGKHAVLYEVVTEGTGEEAASAQRRQHDAYR